MTASTKKKSRRNSPSAVAPRHHRVRPVRNRYKDTNTGGVDVVQKKRILRVVLILILISTVLTFLWPRSFLSNIDAEIKSVSVVIIENNLDHDQKAHTFNVGDPEFDEMMEVLERYPYHISLGTISSRIKKTNHIEGNDARYWLDIYLYTEPDRHGDCYSIISGGTGELIFDCGVYRMGYWGNKTHLKFMTEICQVVDSN